MEYRGVITTRFKRSGIVTFDMDGIKKTATFTKNHVTVNRVPFPVSVKFMNVAVVGTEVTVYNVIENRLKQLYARVDVAGIRIEHGLKSLVGPVRSPSELRGMVFLGVIVSMSQSYSVARFELWDSVEMAYFWKDHTSVLDKPIKCDIMLADVIDIGLEVYLSRLEASTSIADTAVRYKAHANVCCLTERAQPIIARNDLAKKTFPGVVTFVSTKSGSVSFQFNGQKETAIFPRGNVHIDGLPIPKNVPLADRVPIGLEADVVMLKKENLIQSKVQFSAGLRVYSVPDSNQSGSKTKRPASRFVVEREEEGGARKRLREEECSSDDD